MPIEFCKRSVNNQISRASQLETKIDVGKRALQIFIESARLLKNFTPREHARARNRTAVARHLQLATRPGMFRRKTAKSRLRDSIDAKDNPGVLNRVIRIEQSRTYRADFWPLHMLGHVAEPIGFDHLHVVVQKEQPGTLGLLRQGPV